MDWFFGFSGNSADWFKDMIKVAVVSAREKTSLKAHCLYDGDDNNLIEWLKKNNVKVIRTSVPFKQELFSKAIIEENIGSHYSPNNASGHFLRILVSKYSNSKNILYTDCDVMFMGDIDLPLIDNIAVVNEYSLDLGLLKKGFNSGVMVFNNDALNRNFKALCEFFRSNNFYKKEYNSYDQVLLNEFYSEMEVDYIDVKYNWRPFQGLNLDSRIVHFHGPKPHRIENILSGNMVSGEEGLLAYINKNIKSYEYYLREYKIFLSKA